MSFAHFLGKAMRGQKVLRADIFDAPTERVIAEGRFILAVLSLVAVVFAPLQVPRSTQAIEVLVAYAGFAAAVVAMRVCRFPRRPTACAVHVTDVVFLLALSAITKGELSPILAFFIFLVLFAASLRWNWRAVTATAIAVGLGVVIVVQIARAGANDDTHLKELVVLGA